MTKLRWGLVLVCMSLLLPLCALATEVTLDISNGPIDITPYGYMQNGAATYDYVLSKNECQHLEDDNLLCSCGLSHKVAGPDALPEVVTNSKADTYIITGSSYGLDSALEFLNYTGEEATINVVFDDLSLISGYWSTAIRFKGNAALNLNIECRGATTIKAGNHAAFKFNMSEMLETGDGFDIVIRLNTTFETESLTLARQVYGSPAIYHNDNSEKIHVYFYLNEKLVADPNDDDDSSNDNVVSNTEYTVTGNDETHTGTGHEISAEWPALAPMTEEAFWQNTHGIVCTFRCSCGVATQSVKPSSMRIENGMGVYTATVSINNTVHTSEKAFALTGLSAGSGADRVPRTGDSMPLMPLCMLMLAGATGAVTLRRRNCA